MRRCRWGDLRIRTLAKLSSHLIHVMSLQVNPRYEQEGSPSIHIRGLRSGQLSTSIRADCKGTEKGERNGLKVTCRSMSLDSVWLLFGLHAICFHNKALQIYAYRPICYGSLDMTMAEPEPSEPEDCHHDLHVLCSLPL